MTLATNAKRDWERTFTVWSQPPSATQEEKCKRAIDAVRQAIAKSNKLTGLGVAVHTQGSHRNRTSVRLDSDVDTCVLYTGVQLVSYPQGVSNRDVGLVDATYRYADYKSDVGAALVAHFGAANVKRGNKAFDIHENTYRVDADAVACLEYRLHFFDGHGALKYHRGTALIPDNEGRVISSFPDQQYANGVAKHDATGRRFKKVVRAIKCLRNEMEEKGIAAAKPISSFLMESLVWNVPDAYFSASTLHDAVRAVLLQIWSSTRQASTCVTWHEENGIKPLFSRDQKWTYQEANAFALAAWSYCE